jgi:hypothetical protein
MSKKKLTKQIREIADRLPPVKEEHMSGYEKVDGETKGNFYLTDVNHERRLRHAYEKSGMIGIRLYLESIQKLQKQRTDAINNKATKD